MWPSPLNWASSLRLDRQIQPHPRGSEDVAIPAEHQEIIREERSR